jgi:hypothetical protein
MSYEYAVLSLVIPTGAQRSGGTCGFHRGRLHGSALGPTSGARMSYEQAVLILVIPTGAERRDLRFP